MILSETEQRCAKQQVPIHNFGLALPTVAELQVCIQRLDIKFAHLQNFTPLNGCDCNAAEQKMKSKPVKSFMIVASFKMCIQ